jgi:hypothetical protein
MTTLSLACETCKRIYHNCLPKYRVKKAVDIKQVMKQPSFQLHSTQPIPIMDIICCEDIDNIHQTFDAIRINKNHLKVIKDLSIWDDVDFTVLPKLLIELDIADLGLNLIPNCLPPQLKHLTIHRILTEQSWNTPEIFPATLESLTIHHGDGGYYMKQALPPNIFPSSLKHLKTDYLFEKHPIGANVLPQSLNALEFAKNYNQPIAKDVLPSSLKKLYIGDEAIDLDTL